MNGYKLSAESDSAKKKRKTLHLSINEIQPVGIKLDMRKSSKEVPARKITADLIREGNDEKLNTTQNKTSTNTPIINRFTPKTANLNNPKEINLCSMKDFYFSTITQTQQSPIKGRNAKNFIKNIKNTTPNNRSIVHNTSNHHSNHSQTTSHSPFTTTNKSKSLLDSTHNNLPKSSFVKYSNSRESIQNSLKSKSNFSSAMNFYNTNQNNERNKSNIALVRDDTKENIILNQTDQTSEKGKLNQMKILIDDLMMSEDSDVKESFEKMIKSAYKKLNQIEKRNKERGAEKEAWKEKLEEMDKTLNQIKKENEDFKEYMQVKTVEFDHLHDFLKDMKIQMEEIKDVSKESQDSSTHSKKISKGGISPANVRTVKSMTVTSITKFNVNINNLQNMTNNTTVNNLGTNTNSNVKKPSNKDLSSLTKHLALQNKFISPKKSKSPIASTIQKKSFSNKENANLKISIKNKMENDEKAKDDNQELKSNLSSGQSQISLEQTGDIYYTNSKKEVGPLLLKMQMPKLELKLNNDSSLASSEIKSNVMKDNFLNSGNTKDNLSTKPGSKVQQPGLMLNLECLPRSDFNDEFMENAEDFSPSWREGCRKINLFKKAKDENL